MGGAELDLYVIARYLSRKHTVSVITGDWGQGRKTTFDGITVYSSFRLGGRNYIASALRLWRALSKTGADVYMMSAAGPEVGIVAFFCRVYKKRCIFRSVSDIDCDGTYIRQNGLAGRMYAYGLRTVDAIVTCIVAHQVMLRTSYPNLKSPVSYIPLAIEIPQHKPKATTKSTVLWISRCVSMKNPQLFIDLAKHFPEHPFVMIAPRQYHAQALFDAMKAQSSQLKNMQFFDYVPFKQIQKYYQSARVFVNTSDFEGYTYTLIQSGLSATPVAYLYVDPDSVITKYHLGVFAGGDMDKLVAGIAELLEDTQKWRKTATKIKQFVCENHDIMQVGGDWDKLLAS